MDIECTSACKFKSPEILNSLPILKIKPWQDIDLSFMAEFIPDTQRLQWVIISKNDINEPGWVVPRAWDFSCWRGSTTCLGPRKTSRLSGAKLQLRMMRIED